MQLNNNNIIYKIQFSSYILHVNYILKLFKNSKFLDILNI